MARLRNEDQMYQMSQSPMHQCSCALSAPINPPPSSPFPPASVSSALSSARRPIERDLLSLVQLTRWDDRSFHSLSLAAEKAHRKLAKMGRKWEVKQF